MGDPEIYESDMAAAMEIAARFNPRKAPWIAVVIAKYMEHDRERSTLRYTQSAEDAAASMQKRCVAVIGDCDGKLEACLRMRDLSLREPSGEDQKG